MGSDKSKRGYACPDCKNPFFPESSGQPEEIICSGCGAVIHFISDGALRDLSLSLLKDLSLDLEHERRINANQEEAGRQRFFCKKAPKTGADN